MKEKRRVAVVSQCSTEDVEKNIQKTKNLLIAAIQEGADWVVLPEMFPYIGGTEGLPSAVLRTPEVLLSLKELSHQHSVTIFAGSVPEKIPGETRVFNTCYVFSSGVEVARYDKLHLFHLQDNAGKVLYSEHDSYVRGQSLKSLKIDGWHIGLGICYDLRFSGMFDALSRVEPLDAIVLPSAFTQKTGSHWDILTKSRAVEWQCYMIGSNQVGQHTAHKSSYGHSLVIEPWGEVVVNTGHEEGFVIAEIDYQKVLDAKSAIPVHKDRRPEVYA